MYKNELLFVDKFLATLKKNGIDRMPYCNEKYRQGVREMKKYFLENENELDEKVKDIRCLFWDEGESDFKNAIMSVNDGYMISFDLHNPYYEEASIKMNNEDTVFLLRETCLDISPKFMNEITEAFCKGAEIA